MQPLRRNKIILPLLLLVCISGYGQKELDINLPGHDDKKYYFGIMLGYNRSHYNITHDRLFLERIILGEDTIQSVESQNSGRVHLGIMANWQLNKRFDIRFYPLNLIFSEKKFKYTEKTADKVISIHKDSVESIVMSFPLQFRLKSDRIGNFRVYAMAGGKFDFDLASNSNAAYADNIVKVKKSDYGLEGGIGFQFFFPYFVLSPELKFSYGLSNVHSRDAALRYSNVIDKMNSRMLLFSLHFEGGGNQ